MTVVELGEEYVPTIYGPETWDVDDYLSFLNWTGLEHPFYRRQICENDPVMFALVYFGGADSMLVSEETGGRDIHMWQFHIDLARACEIFIRHDFLPKEFRECWVAPRGGAKSTWVDIITLWCAAYGHKEFIFGLAANDTGAQVHMDAIRTEMRENAWLREDFPDLCAPAKVDGKTRSDTKNEYVAESGVAIKWYGIDSNRLGARHGRLRPKLIILDDIENDEGNYSLQQKASRLATVEAILPMNDRAPVLWVGTTTMFDSAVHDLVRTARGRPVMAPWIKEAGWTVRYYPPMVPDKNGNPRSVWEARWPTDYLLGERRKRVYKLHMENDPASSEDGLWTPEDIQVVPDAPGGYQVLCIDPGVKSKKTSDPTGIAVLSYGRPLVVEYCEVFRFSPAQLKDYVAEMLENNPLIHTVMVDVTNGGEYVLDTLAAVVPPGIELIDKHFSGVSKTSRFERLLDFYQDLLVVHADEFAELVRQMLGYPKADHDDAIDAVCMGAEHLFGAEWTAVPYSNTRRRRRAA